MFLISIWILLHLLSLQKGGEKKKFKDILGKHHLVDIWQAFHPLEWEYTFHSKVHDSYHRLDYFLTNQLATAVASSSDIGNAIWSDHMPIFLVVAESNGNRNRCFWKLNDNLLFDEACVFEIKEAIMNFIKKHNRDTTSLPTQWEALKCVVQGLFIKHGSRFKKAKESRTDELLKEISRLELLHKGLPVSGKCKELEERRAELRTLLNEQTLRVRDKNRTLYFQQGSKPGKLLARALRQRVNTSSIIKIKSETGDIAYDPKGILKAFHIFYTRLYNIPNQLAEQDPEKFQQRVYQYIKDTALAT